MKLNVIIATYNRSALLRRVLASLLEAERVPSLEVVITIVDTSTDDTQKVVEESQRQNKVEVRYIFEPQRGKSRALNTGIAQADADLIGLTDDDVEVSADWFVEVARLFSQRWDEVDFAGGKVLPRWEVTRPSWVPESMPGVLSCHDYGEQEFVYGGSTAGQLTGAHGVIKLSALREAGPYNENLGPVAGSMMGSEDDDMYYRLLRAGKRGIYCPRLVIYHRVPAYRLTKSYYRKWCYGWGASQALIDATRPSYNGPRILRVPRYLYGDICRSTPAMLRTLVTGKRDLAFSHELSLWSFAGFFYARTLKGSPLGGLARLIFGKRLENMTR